MTGCLENNLEPVLSLFSGSCVTLDDELRWLFRQLPIYFCFMARQCSQWKKILKLYRNTPVQKTGNELSVAGYFGNRIEYLGHTVG